VDYDEIPRVMDRLRDIDSQASRCLQLLILTATREAEAREARWTEVDLARRLWTIPAERMKAGKEHQIPLSDAAVAVLKVQANHKVDDSVFPTLSAADVMRTRQRVVPGEETTHGMRSCFRDWCGDCTDHPREVAEAALAHRVQGVEGDYRRKTAVEKRRLLMNDWAVHCGSRKTTLTLVA
jgi:integrase